MDVELPQVTGFTIHERLGGGAMGTVYRATPEGGSTPVALKILGHETAVQRQRFRREAQIQGALDHPHLVKVYGSGQDGAVQWIAMELVDGGTLESVVDRLGKLPSAFLAPALTQLAAALAFLHEKHVVHRDLKPGNVMLTSDGAIKIADFGLARRDGLTALTQQGQMMGTLAYMAPEALTGGEPSPATDMYALGVMAYEMATGKLPYETHDMSLLVAAIVSGQIEPPSTLRPELPRAIDKLVMALLVKDPAQRLTAPQVITRLAVAEETGAMPDEAVQGTVKQLVAELEATTGAGQAEWRTAATPMDPARVTFEAPPPVEEAPAEVAPPPPAGARWPLAAVAVALVIAVGLWFKPPAVDAEAAGAECAKRRAALAALVPELGRRVSAEPLLGAAVERWSAAKDLAAKRAASDEAEAPAQRAVAGLGRYEACPLRGVFVIGADGGITCDVHGSPVAAPGRAAEQRALVALLIASSNPLGACVDRQRKVLDALTDATGAVKIRVDYTLADLEREQPALAYFLHQAGEAYALDGELTCSQHAGVQRLARFTAAFSTLPPRR